MDAPLILVIDDDPGVARLVALELSIEGFQTASATFGQAGLRAAREQHPDLVLLDLVLPDVAGVTLLHELKELGIPVIVITASSLERLHSEALRAGADDYVMKPFSPGDLTARVRAVLGLQATGNRRSTITIDGIEIDLLRNVVYRGDELLRLGKTEWSLLQILASRAGQPVGYHDMLIRVWGPQYQDDVRYLKMWITRLRRKLGDDLSRPHIIVDADESGYMLPRAAA